MITTERLTPGWGASHGDDIGLDFVIDDSPVPDVAPDEAARARRVVAGRARDTADARELLDALGLITNRTQGTTP